MLCIIYDRSCFYIEAARLVGDSGNIGRLEVYRKGEWGSVCSNNFQYKEAKVACGMIGFSRPVRAFTVQSMSLHKIVLSGLKCDGTEDHVASCTYEDSECQIGSPVHLLCA